MSAAQQVVERLTAAGEARPAVTFQGDGRGRRGIAVKARLGATAMGI